MLQKLDNKFIVGLILPLIYVSILVCIQVYIYNAQLKDIDKEFNKRVIEFKGELKWN